MAFSAQPLRSLRLCGDEGFLTAETQRTQRQRREKGSNYE